MLKSLKTNEHGLFEYLFSIFWIARAKNLVEHRKIDF